MRFLPLSPLLMVTLSLPGGSQGVKVKAPRVLWDGEWRLQVQASDTVGTLIEEHLKELNFAAKLLWKHKLQAACQTYLNMDILLGQVFSVTFGKELPTDTPIDGTKGAWQRSDGEQFQVAMHQEGARITQTFQGDGYTLTYAYALSTDGQSLAVQVTYANPKRSAPFSYKLAYQKAT